MGHRSSSISISRAANAQIGQNENSYMEPGLSILPLLVSGKHYGWNYDEFRNSEELGLCHGYKNKRRRVERSCTEPKRINHIASILRNWAIRIDTSGETSGIEGSTWVAMQVS